MNPVIPIQTLIESRYELFVKQKPQLLAAVIRALASPDSRISFEGNLANTELTQLAGDASHEDTVLKRATLQPILDFYILPLTPDTALSLEKFALSKVAFGYHRGLVHIQIAVGERLTFGAYDNFQHTWLSTTANIPQELLENLKTTHVLRGFRLIRNFH